MLICFPFGFCVSKSDLAGKDSKAAANERRPELCVKEDVCRDPEGIVTRLEGHVIDGGLVVVVVGHGHHAAVAFASSN